LTGKSRSYNVQFKIVMRKRNYLMVFVIYAVIGFIALLCMITVLAGISCLVKQLFG